MIQKIIICLFTMSLVVFSACSTVPGKENVPVLQDALVETVEVTVLDEVPRQAQVLVKGSFRDGCEYIDEVVTEREEDTFLVTLATSRKGEVCTMALVPFEKLVRLNAQTLKAGSYSVNVNGVSENFEITAANEERVGAWALGNFALKYSYMKTSSRRLFSFFLCCMILVTLVYAAFLLSPQVDNIPDPVTRETLPAFEERLEEQAAGGEGSEDGEGEVEMALGVEVPPELNLAMDFYTQAPFGNWDYPWQEACEEATILLIANEYFGYQWTKEEFNEEILSLVDWQMDRFGYYEHTDMAETALMLRDQLRLDSVLHENPTLEDMKRILAKGHFIVFPADGKQLNNPNFTNGGPVYHVFVVKGYTEDNRIITHDVGTRNGGDYVYSWEVLDAAFHDYATPMSEGARQFLEVLPPSL